VKEILTVAPDVFPGVKSQFEHLAGTTGLTEHTSIVSKQTIEGKKLIIFGAWDYDYYRALKKLMAYDIKKGLLWTSPIGQVGFSPNMIEVSFLWQIRDAFEKRMLDYLFIPTIRVTKAFREIFGGDRVKYLPNTYDIAKVKKYRDPKLRKGEDWVSMYNPAGTRKNMLNQMLGARLADVLLHMNQMPKPLQDFADLIGLRYVDMGWMSKESYFRSIQTMKVGLKVSYSETFDYCLFDHFTMRVPCLFSRTIEWLPEEGWEDLRVENFDDPNEIAVKLSNLMENGNLRREWGKRVYDEACKVAERHNKIAIENLRSVIE